ncbi:unnamed protein product [Bursaphelenchus xylophilus]|uniref:(pine wood nematode) hypothetical protein n=1 Tax=Bursaphelenchus xylophilus TaxID=6326 RepID=A0A1I7S7Z0_BURXY|nr:unnamed protein product [Bursaphelenchus xylophilus]CAG9087256.1 unnamed protein product [Bursaphelenchus xylophilus]
MFRRGQCKPRQEVGNTFRQFSEWCDAQRSLENQISSDSDVENDPPCSYRGGLVSHLPGQKKTELSAPTTKESGATADEMKVEEKEEGELDDKLASEFLKLFEDDGDDSDWDDSRSDDCFVIHPEKNTWQIDHRYKDTYFYPRNTFEEFDERVKQHMASLFVDLRTECNVIRNIVRPMMDKCGLHEIVIPDMTLFDPDTHRRAMNLVKRICDCMENFDHCYYPVSSEYSLHFEQHERALIGIGHGIYRLFQKGHINFTNEDCAICLREKCRRPVVCFQCLRAVACAKCMVRSFDYSEGNCIVKCLKCQRKSIFHYPYFHYC